MAQAGVDDPHHDRVDAAAGEAGDRARQRADDRGEQAAARPTSSDDLAADHQPAEHGRSRGRRCRAGGRAPGERLPSSRSVWTWSVVVEERPDEAEQRMTARR